MYYDDDDDDDFFGDYDLHDEEEVDTGDDGYCPACGAPDYYGFCRCCGHPH